MITIIDYGSGNLNAIGNIYTKLAIPHLISNKKSDLQKATKFILPGVGAFDEVMNSMNSSGLRDILDEQVLIYKKPILGICVGMQILAETSEEGVQSGLGWIKGDIKKISIEKLNYKPHLPHMGWNTVKLAKESSLTENIDFETGFYFLHSYCFHCLNNDDILMTTNYGEEIVSAVNVENIFGTQFHPEKSHSNGIKILQNFANL